MSLRLKKMFLLDIVCLFIFFQSFRACIFQNQNEAGLFPICVSFYNHERFPGEKVFLSDSSTICPNFRKEKKFSTFTGLRKTTRSKLSKNPMICINQVAFHLFLKKCVSKPYFHVLRNIMPYCVKFKHLF